MQRIDHIDLFFDPACPWTWVTSRWLVSLSESESFEIRWRSLTLPLANEDQEIPEELLPVRRADLGLHRVIHVLRARGANDAIGRLYEAVGERTHRKGLRLSPELLLEALDAAGIDDEARAAFEDELLDEALRTELGIAQALAHGDTGSPLIALEERGMALFGPILSDVPTGEDSTALWHALTTLLLEPRFYEVKRNRTGRPAPV